MSTTAPHRPPSTTLPEAAAELRARGFAHVAPAVLRALLGDAHAQWDAFAASWNDLGDDRYMADGGRYRRRRHVAMAADANGLRRKPHQPHYQSRDHNALNGGIERWFAPVEPAVADSLVLRAILDAARRMFEALTPADQRPRVWHIELHQFRIEARAGEAGQPTPEGAHRDGVDWVMVTLVARSNVREGQTTILSADHAPLGSFTLGEPLESALVDDHRVLHGVTPVVPIDPTLPAFRDVLVVTFRHE